MTNAPPVTATLARFLAAVRPEEVPEPVRHEGRRTLLNHLGAALGGCRDAAVAHALAVVGEFAGPAAATLIGRAERTDALTAAFVNGAAANVLDFDDTHLATVIHPAAPVVPAALALAERRRASGAELLHAIVLGVEVECRLGNAVSPWHYARGWHITSTCGVVGAAAAAGRLLGLDAAAMAHALGLGATQACGLVESLGAMAKSVSVGNAPRNGIVAALLAARGFTAAPRTLEGERGFVRVLGEAADAGAIDRGLGVEWEAGRNTYKPYPCGIVLHPVIDALLELRARHRLQPDAVIAVAIRGHPLLKQRTDRPRPRSGREAAVSAQHTAAVCLIDGAAGLAQYSDARAAAADAQALGSRVSVAEDPALALDAAAVEVRTADGRVLALSVAHARGSAARPMTDGEIEGKVRALARHGAPLVDVGRLIDAVWTVDRCADAGSLARLAASPR